MLICMIYIMLFAGGGAIPTFTIPRLRRSGGVALYLTPSCKFVLFFFERGVINQSHRGAYRET